MGKCYFYTPEDEIDQLGKRPKNRAFTCTRHLVLQIRDYSQEFIETKKHDYVDSWLLAVYSPYKPMPSVLGSKEVFDLKAFDKAIGGVVRRRKTPLKPLRTLARERKPIDPDSPEAVIIRSLQRKKKEKA